MCKLGPASCGVRMKDEDVLDDGLTEVGPVSADERDTLAIARAEFVREEDEAGDFAGDAGEGRAAGGGGG